jgi:hypothetical protein
MLNHTAIAVGIAMLTAKMISPVNIVLAPKHRDKKQGVEDAKQTG